MVFRLPPLTWAQKRRIVAIRREARAMEAAGYRRQETDWEIMRGARTAEVIVDAKISLDGKHVWTKLGAAT